MTNANLFNASLNLLLDEIKASHFQTMNLFPGSKCPENAEWYAKQIKNFADNLKVVKGRKHFKIMEMGRVWGFVVMVDNHNKFRKGDILSPSRAVRGNILDGGYNISW